MAIIGNCMIFISEYKVFILSRKKILYVFAIFTLFLIYNHVPNLNYCIEIYLCMNIIDTITQYLVINCFRNFIKTSDHNVILNMID